MSDFKPILTWTLTEEYRVPDRDVEDFLVEGEKVVGAYKTFNNVAVFTNKRLIVAELQGMKVKVMGVYSLPYTSILMWSTESLGEGDISAEARLWTKAGNIKVNLHNTIDIDKFDKILSNTMLG